MDETVSTLMPSSNTETQKRSILNVNICIWMSTYVFKCQHMYLNVNMMTWMRYSKLPTVFIVLGSTSWCDQRCNISRFRSVLTDPYLPEEENHRYSHLTSYDLWNRDMGSNTNREKKLSVAQRIGKHHGDKFRNEIIRSKTGAKGIIERVWCMRGQWAGHVARIRNTSWAKITSEWTPREGKPVRGRPKEDGESTSRKSVAVNRLEWLEIKVHGTSCGGTNKL